MPRPHPPELGSARHDVAAVLNRLGPGSPARQTLTARSSAVLFMAASYRRRVGVERQEEAPTRHGNPDHNRHNRHLPTPFSRAQLYCRPLFRASHGAQKGL